MNLSTECCSCWKQFGCLLCKANKSTVWGVISPQTKKKDGSMALSVIACIIFNDWKPGFFFFFLNKKLLILSQNCLLLSWAKLPSASIPVLPGDAHKCASFPHGRAMQGLHTRVGYRRWGKEAAQPSSTERCGQRAVPWKSLYLGQLSQCLAVGVSQALGSWNPPDLPWAAENRPGVTVALSNVTSVSPGRLLWLQTSEAMWCFCSPPAHRGINCWKP